MFCIAGANKKNLVTQEMCNLCAFAQKIIYNVVINNPGTTLTIRQLLLFIQFSQESARLYTKSLKILLDPPHNFSIL